MAVRVWDEPVEVRANRGRVILRCGADFSCALTADAAVITSDRLFRAGLRAKKQELSLGTAAQPDQDPTAN